PPLLPYTTLFRSSATFRPPTWDRRANGGRRLQSHPGYADQPGRKGTSVILPFWVRRSRAKRQGSTLLYCAAWPRTRLRGCFKKRLQTPPTLWRNRAPRAETGETARTKADAIAIPAWTSGDNPSAEPIASAYRYRPVKSARFC